ncbi:MAG: YfjI family protein [Panacagrimonas sp.]
MNACSVDFTKPLDVTQAMESVQVRSLEWPDPLPLTAKVSPEPYPLDALPPTIRAAVEEVQGFVKAPIPLVASCALAALSLAIQAHVDVKRADKLAGPTGLFLLSIADSGERKSTCDGFFTSAIREYEAQQAKAAEPIITAYKADLSAWEAKRTGLLDAIKQGGKSGSDTQEQEAGLRSHEVAKPSAPRVPNLIRGDDTPENLAWVLAKGWPAGGVVSSEAGIVLGSHGMGKESVMRNLGFLNILWDGGEQRVGRRTSESFTVRGARFTVALQVQEATLRSFFKQSGALARGTGFLARFLIAWPESTQGYRPFTEAPQHWPALATFDCRIREILDRPAPIEDDGTLSPALLSLTPDAKAAWVSYHDAIEEELRSSGELYDVRDVASKSADNAARLASLFHVFERETGAVGADSLESASRVTAWHLNESRRFFGELALPVELGNASRLDSWLAEHCRRERVQMVPTKTIQQYGPPGLRDREAIVSAVAELEELNRAKLVKDGKRRLVHVNPALLTGCIL